MVRTTALLDLGRESGFVTALAGIIDVLRGGENAEWIVGDVSFHMALKATYGWLDAGIEPRDVAGWLRAGCCNPASAQQMVTAGIRPPHLLDAVGQPAHWVDIAPGQCVPVALAVAEYGLPVSDALSVVSGRTQTSADRYRAYAGRVTTRPGV